MTARRAALALGVAALAASMALAPLARAVGRGGSGADCVDLWGEGRLPPPPAAQQCAEEFRRLALEYRRSLEDLARRYPGDMVWLPGEERIAAMHPAELFALRTRGDALERILPERDRLETAIRGGADGDALARYRQLLRAELVLDMAGAARPADGIEHFRARQAARDIGERLAGPVEEVAREGREHLAASEHVKFDPTLRGFVWLARMPDGADDAEPPVGDGPPPLGDSVAFSEPPDIVFPVPGEGGVCPAEPGAQDDLPQDDALPLGDGFTLGEPPDIVFPVPGEGGVCPIQPGDDFIPPIDLVLDGYRLNGDVIIGADRDPRTQLVIAIMPPMRLAGSGPTTGAAAPPPGLVPGGAVAADADPLPRIYVTSLGHLGPGGVEVTAVGGDPAALETQAVVLEPVILTRETTERLLAERREAARQGSEETAAADAYCVEIAREPPAEGTRLRVAPPEVQRRYEPQRRLFDAARQVRDADQLVPDSDRESYFHSILQWSVWASMEAFDRLRFEEAFVEHTKRNFQESDQPWSGEIERAVRGLVPQRWRDIQKILEMANRENQPEGGAP